MKTKCSEHQKRLWFIDEFEKNYLYQGSPVYHNLPLLITISENLNMNLVSQVINKIVSKYDILRVKVEAKDGMPYQMVTENRPVVITQHDFTKVPAEQREEKYLDIINIPFDLNNDLLIRFDLVKLDNEQIVFIITAHYLIADKETLRILFKKIIDDYRNKLFNELAAEKETITYSSYSTWQNNLTEEMLEPLAFYWKRKLNRTPVLYLDSDTPREAVHIYKGDLCKLKLSSNLNEGIGKFCEKHNVKPQIFFLSVFNVLMHKYTNQQEIVVGTIYNNRVAKEIKDILGPVDNLIVLKNEVNENESFLNLLKAVTNDYNDSIDSGEMPFEKIVLEVNPKKDMSRTALFDVLFNYEDATLNKEYISNYKEIELNYGFGKYDLNFLVKQTDQTDLFLTYNSLYFSKIKAKYILEHFVNCLENILLDHSQTINKIKYIGSYEENEMLKISETEKSSYPSEETIITLFEKQVKDNPDKIAVVYDQDELTYSELNSQVNQLASYIKEEYKIKPDDLIGIKLQKDIQLIVTILAILKSGGAYVPIDVDYPQERIDYIINDSSCKVVIDDEELRKIKNNNKEYSKSNLEITSNSSNIAYVIYTSGTTGNPKGSLIEHKNVVQLFKHENSLFDFNSEDIWTMFHSYCFDFSVWEIFGALLFGGKLIIVPPATSRDAKEFVKLMAEKKVTILNQTPSAFYNLINEEAEQNGINLNLRFIIFGGDALTFSKLKDWKIKYPKTKLINMYGITETTVHVTYKEISQADIEKNICNIGRPIPTLNCYILNSEMQIVPKGIAGELYVSGDGLARGYLNRKELTDSRFVSNPFNKSEKLYRSGDKVKMLENAEIEYLGRIDDQVKIRGYRIELGEVENALRRHPKIENAVALINRRGEDFSELKAYIIFKEESTISDVRNHLVEILPEYLIPDFFGEIKSIPLNSNGKIDKTALLSDTSINLLAGSEYQAPESLIEEQLVEIWKNILKRDIISINDDFFELGGHSMNVTILKNKISKKFDVSIDLRNLFNQSILKDQALLITKSQKINNNNIPLVSHHEFYELSPAQYRLWLVEQIGINKISDNMNGSFEVNDHFDIHTFKMAVNKLIERHETLRTIFVEQNGRPAQKILNANDLKFKIEEFSLSDDSQGDEQLQVIKNTIFNDSFNLEAWPLFKVALIKRKKTLTVLYSMHHLLSDGWSMNIFSRDLSALYDAEISSKPALLPILKIQYKDYAAWQNDLISIETFKRSEDFWLSHLSGNLPFVRLPYDKESITDSGQSNYFCVYIDQQKKDKIKDILQKEKVGLFSFLVSCINILINRIISEEDIIIATPVANRTNDDVKDLIGFFLNTIVIRTQIKTDNSFETILKTVNETLINCLQNQEYPFEKLLEKLDTKTKYSQTPLSSVCLNMLSFNDKEDINITDFSSKHFESRTLAKFDLEYYFEEFNNAISIGCKYKRDLFNQSTLEYWMSEFISIIDQIVLEPAIKINKLKMFETPQFQIHIPKPKNPYIPITNDEINNTLVKRFEKIVKTYPKNIAVAESSNEITYSDLNALANGLAKNIAQYKVIDSKIALLLNHGSESIIGILGVLKSANAYVPIDLNFPIERIKYIIQDSGSKIIIANSATIEKALLIKNELQNIEIINISENIEYKIENPEFSSTPNQIAYILYTSGSTGEPKGVIQCHRNVLHFMRVYTNNLHISERDKLSLLPTYSFDASIMDIFGALLNGASLFPYDIKQDGFDALANWLKINEISILHLVPTIYRYFLAALTNEVFIKIRLVVLGGEAVYKSDFEGFKKHFEPGSIFINGCGPTESTVTLQKFLDHNSTVTVTNIPVGFPVSETSIYLLDENDENVKVYQEGEIVYKSNYIAIGYQNKPEQTKKAFTKDPITGNGLVYRSGDFGKLLPTGEIEFKGRRDLQVKLNGLRIELSEIEQNLLKINGVKEAIVLKKTVNNEEKLVAYFRAEVDQEIIKEKIKEMLPFFMLPGIYIPIEKFPLTATGKINRLELPEPFFEDSNDEKVVATTDVEKALLNIWIELLETENIGITDNFFELGGHSLKAIQLISKIIKEFNVSISPETLFNNPTIEAISLEIEKTVWINSENQDLQGDIDQISI